jgi:putative hydrolase of the HAD superfamily
VTTAVYFDLDGTLLAWSRSFADLFDDVFPGDATDEALDVFGTSLRAELDAANDDPLVTAFAAVRAEFAVDADPEALAASFVEAEVASTRLRPSARRLLRTVGERHRVGVLTNGAAPVQRRKIAHHDLADLLDAVVVSGAVGVAKPDDGIFEVATDRLPADAHVYVGDSYEEDVVPAAENGFEAVYVGEQSPAASPVAARDLDDLASLLAALVD